MTLVEIKQSIIDWLKANIKDVNVPLDETVQGFKRPAFFVELTSSSKSSIGQNMFERSITAVVKYYSVNNTNNELLEMQDKLETVFFLSFKAGDRVFYIDSTTGEIIDKVLEFTIEITFVDGQEDKESGSYEYMGELEVKEEL